MIAILAINRTHGAKKRRWPNFLLIRKISLRIKNIKNIKNFQNFFEKFSIFFKFLWIFWNFLPMDEINWTIFDGNFSTNSSESFSFFAENPNKFALILLIIPVATIFGNSLVVGSIRRYKFLQCRINLLIMHLATADFLLGLFVMPVAVFLEVKISFFFF